ncbi:MAG TPA: tetratricopeptide repeat protein [Pirellulales bacterium]|nr:tetratricopeptide repeat protein [Pirellulales bacterium]
MKTLCTAIVVGWQIATTVAVQADVQLEMREASAALQPVLKEAEALVVEGRVDDANRKLLAVFPAESRSSVQSFAVANVLFKHDPKTSYKLHQEAAQQLPNEPDVQFEWALEQHRAREYDGAAKAYSRYTAANPNFAPAYGLLAECLIRRGKVREAVEAWQKSERATQGTITRLESLVCEVHQQDSPDLRRVGLRDKARQGDIDSARDLIALDAVFPVDWWNKVQRADYLEHDLKLLEQSEFKDPQQLNEIFCAGEACIASKKGGDVAAVLRKRGFLLDDQSRLPQSGKTLSTLFGVAIGAKIISTADAREKWGATILERAKASRDVEAYNVAAYLYVGTKELPEIHRIGWEATGDERFAAGVVFDLALQSKLTLDSPELIKAMKQFPENSLIAAQVVSLTAKAKKPMAAVLVQAIKAEYSHFSIPFPAIRPGAGALRGYFLLLAKEPPGET